MGRAPCCEKMGLKKGPWTKEEDDILITYICQHGHQNWRALPKKAGLLRCGKSCRLRWTNYLRPDIKRGNFTKEEEDTIIQLHHALGNRWSKIAARLPGRTDNEIKNVWHTHLKKRLNAKNKTKCDPNNINQTTKLHGNDPGQVDISPSAAQHCQLKSSPRSSSDVSSSVTPTAIIEDASAPIIDNVLVNYLELDDEFWLSVDLLSEYSPTSNGGDFADDYGFNSIVDDDQKFWSDLLFRAEEIPELPDILCESV